MTLKIASSDNDNSRIRSLVEHLNQVVDGSIALDASKRHEALQVSRQLTDALELPQTATTQRSFDVSIPSLVVDACQKEINRN